MIDPRTRRVSVGLFALVFGLPVLYLAVVLCVQPTDRMGRSDVVPRLGRLLYDDYDLTALSLRGLNATLGRKPGAPLPTMLSEEEFVAALDDPPPLQSHFYLEYPHGALLLFRIGFLFQQPPPLSDWPPALLDADYRTAVRHVPRDAEEGRLWHVLRQSNRTLAVLMTLCLLGMAALLARGYTPELRARTALVLLVLPGAMYFALNRFDVVPALLMALALASVGSRRPLAAAVFLGLATALKLYPVLLAPLLLRYLARDLRAAAVWSAVFGLIAGAFLVTPVLLDGLSALEPYRFQLSRKPDLQWTLHGTILPGVLADNGLAGGLARNGLILLTALALAWTRPADLSGLLRRAALLLLLFMNLQVFYSPQWILWLLPLLVPPAGRDRVLFVLLVLIDGLTLLSFPIAADLGSSPFRELVLRVGVIHLRAALLLVLAARLAWTEYGWQWMPRPSRELVAAP